MLKGKHEGFVTFVTDRDARMAFQSEEKYGSKVRTDIAFPWHQPGSEVHRIETNILDLNDDCLFMIFDHCEKKDLVNLSETCVRFANLMDPKRDKPYLFSKIDKTLEITDRGGCRNIQFDPTLIGVHKLVRLMGRYFKSLYFSVTHDDNQESFKYICRYLREVAKYCVNIKHMKFEVEILRDDYISLLEPIFNNLDTLEISVRYIEIDPNTDLTELLPKLKKIHFSRLVLETCLKKSWPSLEGVCYEYKSWADDRTGLFFTLNPQLQSLKLIDREIYNLSTAADRLPNIQKLQISINKSRYDPIIAFSSEDYYSQLEEHFSEHIFDELVYLKHFSTLTELTLDFIDINYLNELQGHPNGLNLKKLHICCSSFDDNIRPYSVPDNAKIILCQQEIVSLAKTHPILEQFELWYLKLDEINVVDFIRFAGNLKSLHLRHCGVFATESLLTRIVDVRKCNQENPSKLQLCFNEILSDELIEITGLDKGTHDLNAIKEYEVQQYLTVNFRNDYEYQRFYSSFFAE